MSVAQYPSNAWHPKFWLTWVAIGFLYISAYLPWFLKISLGKFLGRLGLLVARSRRHITEVNVKLCFPELNAQQQRQLVKDIFYANGIGIFESATALVRNVNFLKDRSTFIGQEHLQHALSQGKGAIILGVHYSALDLGGALHGLYFEVNTIYRPHKNPVFNAFIEKGRTRYFNKQITNRDLKTLARSLRRGEACWYSPDQDYGRQVSVFAPFFGVEAASITMVSRLAKMTGAPVLPLRIHRNADNRTYSLEYLPALENFPSGDDRTDATQVNAAIEQMIRQHPEQYLWLHRRFKTRPNPDDASYY